MCNNNKNAIVAIFCFYSLLSLLCSAQVETTCNEISEAVASTVSNISKIFFVVDTIDFFVIVFMIVYNTHYVF